jgi:hypothetical protein
VDPEPSLSFAYTLDTDLMFGFIEYLFFFSLHYFWSRSSFVFFVAKDIDETVQASQGKIIADLIDPKKLLEHYLY